MPLAAGKHFEKRIARKVRIIRGLLYGHRALAFRTRSPMHRSVQNALARFWRSLHVDAVGELDGQYISARTRYGMRMIDSHTKSSDTDNA